MRLINDHSPRHSFTYLGIQITTLSCSFRRMKASFVSEKFLNAFGVPNILSKNESSLYRPFTPHAGTLPALRALFPFQLGRVYLTL